MKIKNIYQDYNIPLNLQHHMIRVAAFGKVISDLMVDEEIDQHLVVSTLLLHDMGNILKFKLDSTQMLAEIDRGRVEELRAIQAEYRQKYGPSPDLATIKIMKEIGVDQEVVTLFTESSWESLHDTIEKMDFQRKICYYADMRVDPFGVVTLEERFSDLRKRYSTNKDNVENNHKLAKILEKQIQSKLDIDLNSITESAIEPIWDEIEQWEISVSGDSTR